jgi:hypothetical protein
MSKNVTPPSRRKSAGAWPVTPGRRGAAEVDRPWHAGHERAEGLLLLPEPLRDLDLLGHIDEHAVEIERPSVRRVARPAILLHPADRPIAMVDAVAE